MKRPKPPVPSNCNPNRNHAHTPAFKPFPRFPVGRRLDSLAVFRRHALAGRAFACAPGAGRRAVVRRCGAVCFRAAGRMAGGGGGVPAAESGGGKPPLGGSGRGGVVERRAGSFRRPLAVRRGGGAGGRADGSVRMAARKRAVSENFRLFGRGEGGNQNPRADAGRSGGAGRKAT